MKRVLTLIALCSMAAGCASTSGQLDADKIKDDVPEQALPIELGEEAEGIVGPSPADKVDWKSFEVRQNSRLRVRFVTGELDNQLTLRIYRQRSGEQLGILSGRPGQEQILVGNFLAGRYFVEISAESELESIAYTVAIEPTAP